MNDVLGHWIPAEEEDGNISSPSIATWDDWNAKAVLLTCVVCQQAYYFTMLRTPPMCEWCRRRAERSRQHEYYRDVSTWAPRNLR